MYCKYIKYARNLQKSGVEILKLLIFGPKKSDYCGHLDFLFNGDSQKNDLLVDRQFVVLCFTLAPVQRYEVVQELLIHFGTHQHTLKIFQIYNHGKYVYMK